MQNGIVEALDLQMRQSGQEVTQRSRLQNYTDTSIAQNTFGTDYGSVPYVALDQAKMKGLASESSWEYSAENLHLVPPSSVYAEAANYKITSYSVINNEYSYTSIAHTIRGWLAEGKPAILGFRAGSAFYGQSGPLNSQVNQWDGAESGTGHAVLVERMDDGLNGGSYVVKNSWANWGDNGYGTIKYSQFIVQNNDFIGAYAINGFASVDWTFTAQRTNVAELYVALLDRPPDHSGQDYWAGILSSECSDADLANYLLSCEEEQIEFPPSSTNAYFVDKIYADALGREADNEGLDYWVGLLNDGMSRGAVVDAIIDCTRQYVNGANQQHDALAIYSRDLFNNKLNIAMYFGVALQSDDLDAARGAFDNVTNDANSVEIAKIGLYDYYI